MSKNSRVTSFINEQCALVGKLDEVNDDVVGNVAASLGKAAVSFVDSVNSSRKMAIKTLIIRRHGDDIENNNQ